MENTWKCIWDNLAILIVWYRKCLIKRTYANEQNSNLEKFLNKKASHTKNSDCCMQIRFKNCPSKSMTRQELNYLHKALTWQRTRTSLKRTIADTHQLLFQTHWSKNKHKTWTRMLNFIYLPTTVAGDYKSPIKAQQTKSSEWNYPLSNMKEMIELLMSIGLQLLTGGVGQCKEKIFCLNQLPIFVLLLWLNLASKKDPLAAPAHTHECGIRIWW